MKILFDLFPVILFFISYKIAGGHAEQAQAWLNPLLGEGISLAQAPILLATAVTILATMLQVAFLLFRRKKVEGMLWLSLAIVTVFGGATLFFHNATFIKWKPTVLYWAFASALIIGAMMGKNFIRQMMQSQIQLPDAIWARLNMVWALFFMAMGGVNLWVAFSFEEATWVNFKLFGLSGIMFVFVLAQGVFLSRHMQAPEGS